MKILVVDDEKDVEILFRQKLRKEIRSGEIEIEFAFSTIFTNYCGSKNKPF